MDDINEWVNWHREMPLTRGRLIDLLERSAKTINRYGGGHMPEMTLVSALTGAAETLKHKTELQEPPPGVSWEEWTKADWRERKRLVARARG